MQVLGNFNSGANNLQPCFVAVCFDTATRAPSFALIQENPTDIPVVYIGEVPVITRGLLNDCSVSTEQPSEGGGIIRRDCSLTIVTEHAKGYPFYKGPLDKKFYQGGKSFKNFYFGLWAIDRRYVDQDLRTGLFLGYYKVQSGISWKEEGGETTIPLVDFMMDEDNIIGATTEAIPESFFLFNPWYSGSIIPKTFGYVPRVRMLNSFPTISVRKLGAAISGQVQSDYTGSSTTIVLERFSDQSSVLRQFVTIGATVRVRLKDGEVVAGTLTYDSTTQEVTLHITARDTYYGQVKAYSWLGGAEPGQNQGKVIDLNYLQAVILNGKNLVQAADGFISADINFPVDDFDTATTKQFTVTNCVTQLDGWIDESKGRIKHKEWKPSPTSPKVSSISYAWSNTATTSVWPDQYGYTPQENFFYILPTPRLAKLYFNNPNTSSPGSGSIGDPWSLVGIDPVSLTYECYLRNGFSHFSVNNVYCEGDGRLIKVPLDKIVSFTDSTTVSGLTNIAKLVLTAAPVDMDIGATSNIIYTDAMFRTGDKEDRAQRILYEILKDGDLPQHYVGTSITSPPTGNIYPYIGYYAEGNETVLQVVDRLLYQIGATFRYRSDYIDLGATGQTSGTETEVTVDSSTYIKPIFQSIDESLMLENTADISVGQLTTRVDGSGYEFIPLYYDVDYGSWQDPFYKPVKPSVNRARKPYERKFSYSFDLINDQNSAAFAIGSSLAIGHPSGLATTERVLSTEATLHAAIFEALDTVVYKDFPLISSSDETNAVEDTDGQLMYLKPSDGKKFVMGAVAQVVKTSYLFSMDQPRVVIEAKVSQTFTQASGVNVFKPPYPPLPPPPPSGNPNLPPNTGGGHTTGPGGTAPYVPYSLAISTPASIAISTVSPLTTTFTITDAGTGSALAGGTYTLEIIDDGMGVGSATVLPNTGSLPDRVHSAFSNTHTITVDYTWFPGDLEVTTSSRSMFIKLTRSVPISEGSSLTADYISFISCTITIINPIDISVS